MVTEIVDETHHREAIGFNYHLGSDTLSTVDEYIPLTSQLSWKRHITNIATVAWPHQAQLKTLPNKAERASICDPSRRNGHVGGMTPN